VTPILPGQNDSWHAGRGYFERRGAILHFKTALVDGVWAMVGSTNLDWRSFLHKHELNAVVLGAEFGSQLQAMFERDLAESDTITLAQWQRRGLGLRLKELFARAREYWL
jgi:cardiolipin synthase A/B